MSGIITAAGIAAAGGLASSMLTKGAGGGGGGQQGQMQQTQLPEWYNNGLMGNWGKATDLYYTMKGPYEGNRVADLTPEQRNLISQLYGNVGSTNAAFNTAQGITNGLAGYNPMMVNPQLLRDTNLNPYMNPYTQSVIDPSMKLLDQSLAGQQNATAASAVQNKAFGGSRHGIVEGMNNAQTNLLKGQLAGQLNSANFQQAQAAATGDITRNLTAQQSNQSADLLGARFRGDMANQLGGLATQGQNSWLTGMNAAMSGQGLLQANDQAKLDADRQLYEEQRQFPLQRLQILQNALAQSPYTQTSYSSSPGGSGSPLMTGLGTASTLLGMYGTLKNGGLFGSAGGGGGGLTTDQVMKIALG